MTDPIARFSEWLKEARAQAGEKDVTAMTLATATKNGMPSARLVLLKAHDDRGFVFYTNFESRKSRELKENPHAALCFYWDNIGRQVRIEGDVSQVSDVEADEYFASRALESRLSAIASAQSRPLASREALQAKVHELSQNYSEARPPKRPAFWSGWRVAPQRIEFWQEGKFRLHDRELFTRDGAGWKVERLYP